MTVLETAAPLIRTARDADADGLIRLVGACFAEYPGCILDVDGEIPELRAIASYAGRRGGRFWVVEQEGRIVGSIGCVPAGEGAVELIKLYVAAEARRQGLGRRLVGLVEEEAQVLGADRILLWSDTRFEDAHRLYERCGYVRSAEMRALHDSSDTVEYRFEKRLDR